MARLTDGQSQRWVKIASGWVALGKQRNKAVAYVSHSGSAVENLLLPKPGSLNPCAHESYPAEQACLHVLHIAESPRDV